MKVVIGDAKLNPDILFRVSASDPPPDCRTLTDLLAWQDAEHKAMMDEVGRLFREQLQIAFEEFEAELMENLSQH